MNRPNLEAQTMYEKEYQEHGVGVCVFVITTDAQGVPVASKDDVPYVL